jgi:serine/threonine-protein kinase RsbW
MEMADSLASVSDSYPAVPDSVPRARGVLSAFAASAGLSNEQLEGVRLAVSEAVTNVVRHAYGSGDAGEIHVSASLNSGELRVLIADDGCGLPNREGTRGLGLGLVWMAEFSDGLKLFTRPGGGLEVRLRFNLPGHDERTSLAEPGIARHRGMATVRLAADSLAPTGR